MIPLELRRIHLDLIFTYKLLHDKMKIDKSIFFDLKVTKTRGHRLTISKPIAKKEVRRAFYSNRIVNIWNSLPKEIALAPSISCFKKSLQRSDVTTKLKQFLRGKDLDV